MSTEGAGPLLLFLLEEGTFKFNPVKPLETRADFVVACGFALRARRVHSLRFIEQYVPDFRYVAKKSQHGFDEEQVADLTLMNSTCGKLSMISAL